MFLLYHSERCNICKTVLLECYVNDLYSTICSGVLGHHKNTVDLDSELENLAAQWVRLLCSQLSLRPLLSPLKNRPLFQLGKVLRKALWGSNGVGGGLHPKPPLRAKGVMRLRTSSRGSSCGSCNKVLPFLSSHTNTSVVERLSRMPWSHVLA
jgi:hypothetical protein